MKTSHLNKRQMQIVQSLRDKVTDDRKALLDLVISDDLPPGDIEAVCRLINDEYLMNGIDPGYRANEYGRELEGLLDIVNRPRLKGQG